MARVANRVSGQKESDGEKEGLHGAGFVVEGPGCIFTEHCITESEYYKDFKVRGSRTCVELEILALLCWSRRSHELRIRIPSFEAASLENIQRAPGKLEKWWFELGKIILLSRENQFPFESYHPEESKQGYKRSHLGG